MEKTHTKQNIPQVQLPFVFIRTSIYVCLFSVFIPQTFKEDKYLKDAMDCSDVIWQRGLLRKGYGICHGTAGNGYSFLSLYNLTQDKKYLYRACKVSFIAFQQNCCSFSYHNTHARVNCDRSRLLCARAGAGWLCVWVGQKGPVTCSPLLML